MSATCTVNPQVLGPDGQLHDSILFKQLKNMLGYNKARRLYLRYRSESFREKYDDSLSKDANGEYTIESLSSLDEMKDLLGIESRVESANANISSDIEDIATRENIDNADDRALSYNTKTEGKSGVLAYTETFVDNDGEEKVRAVAKRSTPEVREKANEIRKKRTLNSRLRDMLEQKGISVGVLNELERKIRVNGVTDFNAALITANGLRELIRLADNEEGEMALPEEFSHLVLEALKDNPVVERLRAVIKDNKLYKEILYDEYDQYNSSYKGNEDKLVNEAMGKIVSRHILAQNDIYDESTEGYSIIRGLIERLVNAFHNVFSRFSKTDIDTAIEEANKLSEKISFDLMEGGLYEEVDFNSITGDGVLYKLSEKSKKQRDLVLDIINNNVRRYKIINHRDNDYDKDFDKEMIARLSSLVEDEEYEVGIYEFVNGALEQLIVAEEKLNELRSNNNISIEKRAKDLKNIKDFILSFSVSVSAIQNAEYEGIISPKKNMNDIINQTTILVSRLMNEYEAQKTSIVMSFIKSFIGSGITVPFGKNKGKIYTAEDIIRMAEKDISIFDRWLDSMAEANDWMLRMLDSTAKTARNKARMNTLSYKRRIDNAYMILKKSGITNTDFMYERTADGKHKTGNYINKDQASKLDIARRRYYDTFMEIKKELDNKLPDGSTKTLNIIRVRKDYIERLKSENSIEGIVKQTKEALKDKVKRRSDNAEAGTGDKDTSLKSVLLNFENEEVDLLPIMYVNQKDGESIDDISEDSSSSLLMYAYMSCNFDAMNKVVGLLELVREKIKERPVQQTEGGKVLINSLKAFGITVPTEITKSGENTRIVQRMNDWFKSQVYMRYMADEGEILGMDIGMLANMSNEITSLNQFAGNILSGISNVMTGSSMGRIESICGQYFSVKDLANADITFWKNLPEYLAEVGSQVKTSKLALFMEKYNTMQDFEGEMLDPEYRKSRLGRLMQSNSLYVINNAGELWLQNRTALALGESLNLVDENGKKISLFDAHEVVVNSNGVAKLILKKGVKFANGSEINDNELTLKFTKKSKSINQRMHGIYNYEDRNAAQAYAIGRMGLMFRKWIKPSLNRRYGNVKYNFDVEEWEEGFYNTAGRFFLQLYRDIKRGQLDIMLTYSNLDPREKQNMIRFAVEVGQFVSVCAAFAVLKDIKDKDDDGALANSWWFNQFIYQMRRLESEIGSQMIINPQMTQEAFKILKSPAAAVDVWEGIANMTKLMMPSSWTTEIQSGKYKGHSRAYKYFWDSPIVPMHRTIYRGLHPENSLNAYIAS